MSEQWFKDYIQLQFRMDKATRKFTESRFVDYYYGPPEWKAAVETEEETPAPELVRAAMALLDALPAQGFEAHRRTQAFVELARGEEVELALVTDKVYGGDNWYLGNFRSHVDVNTDLPTNMGWLMGLICHECYAGHHTEFVLKEQRLYQERG